MTLRKQRPAAFIAALLGVTLVLTACSSGDADTDTATSQTRSFEADNGTIDIPVDPERIIGIQRGASNLLEFGIKPVGIGQFNEDPVWLSPTQRAVYDSTPVVADFNTVDYEKIASLKPDLIVVSTPDFIWEKSWDNERLQSIAPTVYIEVSNANWKVQEQRVADALGKSDEFNLRKAEYDDLLSEMRTDHKDILSSATLALINRHKSTKDGEFLVEGRSFYCTTFGTELGINFPETSNQPGDQTSMERIGDLANYNVLLYPLGPDGSPKQEVLPVLDSNAWKALPQVSSDRTRGLTCTGGLSYPDGVTNLQSLDKALSTLPALSE
ncbi:ABC transporter substrate-binding protein [Rhodococcus cerastii]|nr:ABC transporter substrate-binding protein [Rhodococcus cerastii]